MSPSASRKSSPRRTVRLFVTATDTGVGKTQTSRALLSLLADAGHRPAPFKPYESGCEDLRAPADSVAMRDAARSRDPLSRICVHRFKEPLAPGIAAARLGQDPPFAQTVAAFRSFAGRSLIAEGAGGLFVPIDRRRDIIDLIAKLKLPVVLVARAGLGTLNHTALSLEALGARRIPVRAVVLSQGTPSSDPSTQDNSRWIAERHGVTVIGPVPFEAEADRRHQLFREALRPLVQSAE